MGRREACGGDSPGNEPAQYNDPALHGLELTPKKKEQAAAQEEKAGITSSTATTVDETSPAEPVEAAVTTAVDSNDPQE